MTRIFLVTLVLSSSLAAHAGEELVLLGPPPGSCALDPKQPPVKHPVDLTVGELIEAYAAHTCKQYLVPKLYASRRVKVVADTIAGDPEERLDHLLRVHELHVGQRVYHRIDHWHEGDLLRETEEPPPRAQRTFDLGARCAGSKCTVPRARVEALLTESALLAEQARVVPAVKDGKPLGFKLFSIRAGSVYAQLGLQNGDVVLRLNGMGMGSPEGALEAYTKLRSAPKITIELLRRDVPVVIELVIK